MANQHTGKKKTLTKVHYTYLEEDNKKHAVKQGKKIFGSASAYINALIAVDRGALPSLGAWKAPGESDLIRKAKRKSKRRGPKNLTHLSALDNEAKAACGKKGKTNTSDYPGAVDCQPCLEIAKSRMDERFERKPEATPAAEAPTNPSVAAADEVYE
jgi:hypothetical protein